jgi:hypothetical protein
LGLKKKFNVGFLKNTFWSSKNSYSKEWCATKQMNDYGKSIGIAILFYEYILHTKHTLIIKINHIYRENNLGEDNTNKVGFDYNQI